MEFTLLRLSRLSRARRNNFDNGKCAQRAKKENGTNSRSIQLLINPPIARSRFSQHFFRLLMLSNSKWREMPCSSFRFLEEQIQLCEYDLERNGIRVNARRKKKSFLEEREV